LSKANDSLFKREKKVVKKGEESLFDVNTEPIKNPISPERLAIQSAIDKELTEKISKVDMLSAYLKAKFSLSKSDKPHTMIF
jgi:large subunit ribosomal protein L6e